MDRAKLSEILGHQLKGIMLHSDLCRQALYQNNKKFAFTHYKHTLEETKNFLLTNEKIIDKYGMIIEPTREARLIVPANATEPEMRDMWYKWEHETLNIYNEAKSLEPTCKWWTKLADCVKREMTTF